jgi:hypothetical protein
VNYVKGEFVWHGIGLVSPLTSGRSQSIEQYVLVRPHARLGAVIAVVAGAGFYFACRATSRTADGDFFDSPLWAWAWIIFPIVAVALVRLMDGGPVLVAVGLVVPQAVGVIVEGVVLFDHSADVSFWPVGLMVVVVLFAWTAGDAALLGRSRSHGREQG